MWEYLDPVAKTLQCAQYVDDIGIAANDDTDLINESSNALAKPISKWQKIGAISEPGQLIFRAELFHQEEFYRKLGKSETLSKSRFPKSKNALQRYLGSVIYYRN